MKTYFSTLIVTLALLFAACSDSPTVPEPSKGEIYGEVTIMNQYSVRLSDQSGLTAQLLEDDKIVQTTATGTDGLFSFKNVETGVYTIRCFKPGYARYIFYNFPDTLTLTNIQFVGRGRFKVEDNDHGKIIQFFSTSEPDSSYWAIKPDIRYEVIKEIKAVSNVLIRTDTIGIDSSPYTHNKYIVKNIYGNGTEEKRKIRLTFDFEHTFPDTKAQRTIGISMKLDNSQLQGVNISSAENASFVEYEYTSPNTIIRDELGKIVNRTSQYSNTYSILYENISFQAITTIPNSIRRLQDPQRIIKSKELTISLVD